MSTAQKKPKRPTKSQVEKRIRDWKRRIEALFEQVEQWGIDQWGEDSVVRGSELQLPEYWMKQTGVRPRKLPTLEFRAGERRIEFHPSCLWIIGANGRIDVRVGSAHYTLCDMAGEDGKPSDWQISNPDPRVVLERFTRDVFLRIANAGSKTRR